MTLRPYGTVIAGRLELGLELVIDIDGEVQTPHSKLQISSQIADRQSTILEVRPHTSVPEPYVISPAFVNAHSHLEYRGLMGGLESTDYWPWLREITAAKRGQAVEDVRRDCHLAAAENRATGVALIGEHSDRPFAGDALHEAGIEGVIFQEVITLNEADGPEAKLRRIEEAAEANRSSFDGPVCLSPHAYFTVDRGTLSAFGERSAGNADLRSAERPISIHVAESLHESEFTRDGKGPIAELYRSFGIEFEPTDKNVVETLAALGLAREGAQWVHCCDLSATDVHLMAAAGVTAAHCPRSNRNLNCPIAPVREMIDAGIPVGLGLDSAASSGPIDMFAEMRFAVESSVVRGRPLMPEEVWLMATSMGARSLPIETPVWEIAPGSNVPLISIHIPDATCTEDLIERGSPELIRRFDLSEWAGLAL